MTGSVDAGTHVVETRPTAVTVYADRARVTRAGRHTLPAGNLRLEVDNLPLALLPESVRAAGKGTARARLLGITTRLEHFVETPAEAVRELEDKIQSAEDADADLAAQAASLEKEQKHLEGLATQSEMLARGIALRGRTLEEQGAFFDFVRQRTDSLQAQVLKIARDRRALAKELDRLRRELRQVQSARPRQRYVAAVELDVTSPGEFELELSYVVTGARWKPLYDVRLLDSMLEMSYLAQVAQNTGEDWPEVALVLSTAQPALDLTIPELSPWYIQPRLVPPPQPVRRKAVLMAAPAPAQAAVTAVAEVAADEAPVTFGAVAVSESGAALTYRLPAQHAVPGNNEPRKVNVASFRLKPDMTYITAPRLEPVCYRRAEVKNDTGYSLLPGSAHLFEGDEYLGATDLEFVAPGQTFELALGADERLRVEHELAARDVDKAFVIGDRRRIRYAYKIEVQNLRDTPQTVVVRDQIPVSRDEQIKVKLDSADPRPVEHTELNQLEWKLVLDRSATQAIRFDFTVEYPRTMDVLGLP